MPLSPAFRTLFAAAGIALTLGGAALAQEAAETEEGAVATEGAATEDGGVNNAGPALRQTAPADQSTDEGGPVEPTDAQDGADTAATDASGNTSDDPAPTADPEGNETLVTEATDDLPIIGQPVPNGINLQPSMSDVAADTRWLDTMINWIMLAVVVFVTGLLLWVIYRFHERRNLKPAGFTHNSPLEITWTVVPIVILVFIGAFSLPVLFVQQEIPEGDVHITVTGYQWYWNYQYPDENIGFDSYMIGYGEGNLNPEISAQLQEAGFTDAQFKLATDTEMVVPVGATVVVTVTGGDVIHNWNVPALGVKQDAVPGRLAQVWFNAEEEGIYFAQCMELCGKDHAFMPIQVRAVSPGEYEAWVAQAQAEFPLS
jgi:cytochrome c oxidase subunit 2